MTSIKIDKSEKQWMEENDARTIAMAEVIKSDPNRMEGAKAGAKRLQKEVDKRARDLSKEANVLKKISGNKTGNKKSSSSKKKK